MNGPFFYIKKEKPVVIALQGDKTTGFIWTLKCIEPAHSVQLIHQQYVPWSKKPGDAFEFYLHAWQPGITTVTFEYIRPDEPSPVKRARAKIMVESKSKKIAWLDLP